MSINSFIRSFRGFFLYALEIMQTGKDYEILTTNLQPFFWRKVKNIIRQNKKGALLEFLFGKAEVNQDQTDLCFPHLEDQIQTLQNQVNSLQQKIIELEENQTLKIKKALSELLKQSQPSKTIQQGNYTLKPNMGSYFQENDTKINPNLQQGEEPRHQISKSLSEDKYTLK